MYISGDESKFDPQIFFTFLGQFFTLILLRYII